MSSSGIDDLDSKTEIIKIKTKADGKQTVDIRTDIYISDTKNNNKTAKPDGAKAENDSNEDSEIPIFRGTDNSNNRNSYNRRYDSNNFAHNRPIFQRTNDDVIHFDRSGTWINFVPVTWTTERNYDQNLIQKSKLQHSVVLNTMLIVKSTFINCNLFTDREFPNSFVPYTIDEKSYKPCLCSNDDTSWTHVSIPIHRRSFRPTTIRPNKLDDKLEDPFSEAG